MSGYYINRALVKLIVIGLLASFLAACSLPQVKPTDALEPDKGFVIIRIINNVDFVSQNFDRSWGNIAIRLKTNDEDRRFRLTKALSATMKSTQIFIGQFSQGTYELLELNVISTNGNRTYSSWLPLDKLGTFKVVPGHITNLGTIICQPVDARRYHFIHINNDTEVQELIKTSYPLIYKAASGNKMIEWDNAALAGLTLQEIKFGKEINIWNYNSPLANTFIALINLINHLQNSETEVAQKNILNKSAMLSLAKANSAGFNNPRQIATGEIFAGSKLGQILVKERDGKWAQLDTGYMHEIIAVLPINRNTIYAGGEQGLFLATNDGGRSWKKIETPLKSSILFIERVNGRFFIGSDLFYETSDIFSNNWKAIGAIKPNNTYRGALPSNKLNYPEYTSYIDKGKFYLFMPYNSAIFVLDLSTNIWSTVKTPFDDGNIYSLKNGFFFNVGFSLWLGPRIAVSHDFGNSWITTHDAVGVLYCPIFKDNYNGFVLRYNVLSNNITLRKTHNSGENWKEVNDFNDLKLPHPTKLFYDYVNNKLYFAVDGMIYIASDDLQIWTRVR